MGWSLLWRFNDREPVLKAEFVADFPDHFTGAKEISEFLRMVDGCRHIKIDNILETFNIERSLSRKGNPYDNAVSEAMNKVLKVEFIYQNKFKTLEELELQLAEYIYWYNNIRIHGSLGYISPAEFRYRENLELSA